MISTDLTAIIPLRYTLETLEQVKSTVTRCKNSLVRVILVVDQHKHDPRNSALDDWLIKSGSDIEILQGNYFGPGSARNVGLEKFKENPTRWLVFWDADDSPSVGEIVSLTQATALADKVMIVGNFTISKTFNSSESKSIVRTKTTRELGIQGGLWRIIFNFELLEQFPEFPNLRMGEDQVFLARLAFNDDKIEFVENNIYTYRRHSETQLMNSVEAISEVHQALEAVCQDIRDGKPRNSISNTIFANLAFSMILKRNWNCRTLESALFVVTHHPSVLVSLSRIYFAKLSLKLTKPKPAYVFLTGGLGNQLFQLASALKVTHGPVVGITSSGSQYRGEEIDIEKFEFPFLNVMFRKLEGNRLLQKTFNLGIRLSIRKTWLERLTITRFMMRLFLMTFFTVYFRQRVVIKISDGVSGLNEIPKNRASVSIGYFQNSKNFSDSASRKVLENCYLKSSSDQKSLAIYEARAVLKMPCVIHVRLGDYLSTTDFHHLDKKYYYDALLTLATECEFSEIWLFSDEPTRALEFIPPEFQGKVYIPEIPTHNSTLTLEVMKLGACYVIANSTFSWWAAFLRKNLSAKVIAPKVWFRNDNFSKPSYPADWQTL
jgi:glycosyltransferase involved in cell wall biosynthesis